MARDGKGQAGARAMFIAAETVLVNPGIDSNESIPTVYVAGTTNRVFVPARQARNRFLGSLKRYKFALGSNDPRE